MNTEKLPLLSFYTIQCYKKEELKKFYIVSIIISLIGLISLVIQIIYYKNELLLVCIFIALSITFFHSIIIILEICQCFLIKALMNKYEELEAFSSFIHILLLQVTNWFLIYFGAVLLVWTIMRILTETGTELISMILLISISAICIILWVIYIYIHWTFSNEIKFVFTLGSHLYFLLMTSIISSILTLQEKPLLS